MGISIRSSTLIPLSIIGLLAIVPMILRSPYFLHVLLQFFFYVALAQSWNLIAGYTGQFCFGQQTFFAIGAYTTALIYLWEAMPLVGMALGGLLAAVTSFGIGVLCFRLRGHYFAIATLCMAEVLRLTFINWDFVGRSFGLSLPVIPLFQGETIPYYLFLVLALSALFLVSKIRNSWFGLALKSIREDEDAARTVGINTTKYKLLSFAISAALAGLAGGGYVLYHLYVDPDTAFSTILMFEMIIMVTIGGIGTVFGPVLGAALLTFMQEYILFAFPAYQLIISGSLLVITMIFLRGGLISFIKKLGLSLP